MQEIGCLTILPAFSVKCGPAGRVTLTRKFLSGVEEFSKHWPGPVRVVAEELASPTGSAFGGNLDEVEVQVRELPFDLKVVRFEGPPLREALEGSSAVLLAVHFRQIPVAALCAKLGIPAVFVAENSLWTKMQMLAVEAINPVVRLRRAIWLLGEERRTRAAVRKAAGIQCNGVPTFEAYRGIAKDALLYFDSRVREAMLASEEAIERRARRLREGRKLRPAFSGRLVAIKGADHLVDVAEELKRRGVHFELSICGAGELEAPMRAEVARLGLEAHVLFKGVMDFENELVPWMRDEVDVFVCCHRQGDPSCTYLETMACGVPIAGYGNEAFLGIVQTSEAGWATAMNRPAELATMIASLTAGEIHSQGIRGLTFAREHTFEKTFARRTQQLRRLADANALAMARAC